MPLEFTWSPTRYSTGAPEPATGELGDDADVRCRVALPRHHDDVVSSVADDVADLEVVVAVVLDGVDHGCAKMAQAVVEEHADGAGPPPDRGEVETGLTVELTGPDLEAVDRVDEGRLPERAVGELREAPGSRGSRRPR